MTLAFVPSAFITDTEGIATKPVPRSVTASFFPSCEYAGNGAESARSNSGSMLNNRRFWGQTGTGGIRVLPETDNGVRSAAGTVPRATRGSDPGSHSAGRDAKGTAQEEERQSTV